MALVTTGTLESVSTTTSIAPTSISVASHGVVTTGSNHLLKDGQQIKFTSPSFAVDSVAVTTDDIFTVRNGNAQLLLNYLMQTEQQLM